MYRIMLTKSKRSNGTSLYQFLTTTVDGKTYPYEIETKEALDKRVKKMLNKGGYSKDDFIIVTVIDYNIEASNYTDDEDDDDDDDDDETVGDTDTEPGIVEDPDDDGNDDDGDDDGDDGDDNP